jgi:hypothetical protein|tara:strand:+ start:183 stop:614 length:432 start_codon:yes stop_codon:yes gene_type:complete
MPLGNILSGADQQYVGLKDETGTWRILNTWHEDLKQLDADDDIPDTSEAVTVLSEGQFIALIKEAASLGVLENVSFSGDTEAYEFEIEELQARIEELKTELREKTTVIEPKTPHSEEYELKERAMETILKLVSIDELSKLSKD